ncbi:MAG TPA: FHA domain-containing protein, partial [Polyangiaceae bacterium]|nr:FHA domain-containing protein [Polyangiaceae bacterium]
MEPSFLLVARADSSPIIFPLSGKRCVIGRKPHADIVIDHWSVSRNHAVIEQGPSGRWWILDLGSMNGTFVNGTKVTERLLSRGDVVRIGDCTIVLRQPSVMEFPSPMSVGPGTLRLGSEAMRSGPGSERSMLSTVASSQRIDAEQLASIMKVGRSLLQVEESSARLRTLCEFVVGDLCPAIEAGAIRIAEGGVYETLCDPSAQGVAQVKILIDGAVVRRFLDKREPMIATPSMNLELREPGKVRMLIPIAEIGTSLDALSVVLPAQYGTAEWLMLFTLLAEAYQQSELVWDMRHQVRQNAFIERELEMACQIQTGLVPKQFAAP